MPVNNNDTYNVNQANGLNDSDIDLNVATVTQLGIGNFAGAIQGVNSGGNTQGNASAIFDTGGTGGLLNDNDDYQVGQQNLMNDADGNLNLANIGQAGFVNFAGVHQHTTSGNNDQTNISSIEDSGGGFGFLNNNDDYHVNQFNGLLDSDQNINAAQIGQIGLANLAGVAQDTDSGGNTQNNTSTIDDGGLYLGAFNGNDSYHVGQQNNLFDQDANGNGAGIYQFGIHNFAGVLQSIDSGGNSQGNSSTIADYGGGFGFGNGNDTYAVNQFNGLLDSDHNTSIGLIGQAGIGNIAGVDQVTWSGGNDQSNTSNIADLGFGWGVASNNDHYTVGQSNIMFDNDINTNVGIVAQLGVGNSAFIDQDIWSGGNSQSNSSTIYDTGGSGFFSNNDTYDVTQANYLNDQDANANASVAAQVGLGNFAGFIQDIDSGGNTQGNVSTITDLGA
ncbi:hypothetical protein QNA08_05655 [Chelatococcus sp. SYSU_G07232]|uniref:Curlin associated repeat-containing protein n=1 Tax=Chelatococcus albus TaxID=3047466 RepID=A0ABT7AEB0_9HYPH|nr:hypothetical protein [Chelatococcus sp. SYSU_G07232]MDJ1157714.1 hypothetical protein [Chelatococcus sp. SYSU_G07232]